MLSDSYQIHRGSIQNEKYLSFFQIREGKPEIGLRKISINTFCVSAQNVIRHHEINYTKWTITR